MKDLEDCYLAFYNEAKLFLGERIFKDYLRRFAYSIDASCYRYIPKLVVWAKSESEIQNLFRLSQIYNIALSFKAGGTSLSGQACSDSVLVIANNFWKDIVVMKEGGEAKSIWCDCGVIGADANKALKPYNKKIGPDPATINNALIGGIFSNNSSGMCCGVKQNSYQTIKSIRVILGDGTILDTSDIKSIKAFTKSHTHIVSGLLDLRKEILEDKELYHRIKTKFAIKNTTGYAINTFVDFESIRDILNHIFIGAEGTLGFISRVEYECVRDFANKACALLFYEDLLTASHAIKILAKNDNIVSAAEIMDYASLLSVQNLEGLPQEIKQIREGNCAILVELQEDSKERLEQNIAFIQDELKGVNSLFGNHFSFDLKEQESWWKIRKGLLPLAAAMRPSGSTVITEDICFHIEHFAPAMQEVSKLFTKHSFDGIIFGHALSGNVHFIITPILGDKEECERFGAFMEDLVELVCSYDGSIKAEHGTGRMMAPFVEREWGEKAYEINKRVKAIFDSQNLINPNVMISEDKDLHLKNLKPAGANLIEDYLDACMECGFCEKICPSKNLTLTPRQRIAVYREIKRLESLLSNKDSTSKPSQSHAYEKSSKDSKSGESMSQNIKLDSINSHANPSQDSTSIESRLQEELEALKEGYKYFGVDTCATCSMCATLCPLEIDTAKIALNLSQKGENAIIRSFGNNIARTTKLAKFSVGIANVVQKTLGDKRAYTISSKAHDMLKTPILSQYFPSKNSYELDSKVFKEGNDSVIYFSSCLNRMFAPSAKAEDSRPIASVFESVCKKANYNVIYPKNITSLCCGKAYKNDKGMAKELLSKAYQSLLEVSKHGEIPIVCDHSACSLELLKGIREIGGDRLKLFDMPAFIQEYLTPKLKFIPPTQGERQRVALYAPCGTRNLSLRQERGKWESAIFSLARACGVEIVCDENVKCCGFAGNKGFILPKLNQSALDDFGMNHISECEGVESNEVESCGAESNVSESSSLDYEAESKRLDSSDIDSSGINEVESKRVESNGIDSSFNTHNASSIDSSNTKSSSLETKKANLYNLESNGVNKVDSKRVESNGINLKTCNNLDSIHSHLTHSEKSCNNLDSLKPHSSKSIFEGVNKGFSSSSTCEIGLSDRSGFAWQHIVYLVDSYTK